MNDLSGALRNQDQADRRKALAELLDALARRDYRFVTPTNPTLRTVRRRLENAMAQDLRGVLGWSLPFERAIVPSDIFDLLHTARVLRRVDGGWRSEVRVSSLDDALFLHSAFPTNGQNDVFFGPDTYRYVRFVRLQAHPRPGAVVVDVGAGSGAGGVMLGRACPGVQIKLTDISPLALELAGVNARANGVAVTCLQGEGLDPLTEPPDLVIANPPFIADRKGQLYQDGGDAHGMGIAAAWAKSAMQRLNTQGRMILYTGSPIIGGHDPFRARLETLALRHGCGVTYQELDPDIFGAELRRSAYADVERIAAVGVVIDKR